MLADKHLYFRWGKIPIFHTAGFITLSSVHVGQSLRRWARDNREFRDHPRRIACAAASVKREEPWRLWRQPPQTLAVSVLGIWEYRSWPHQHLGNRGYRESDLVLRGGRQPLAGSFSYPLLLGRGLEYTYLRVFHDAVQTAEVGHVIDGLDWVLKGSRTVCRVGEGGAVGGELRSKTPHHCPAGRNTPQLQPHLACQGPPPPAGHCHTLLGLAPAGCTC